MNYKGTTQEFIVNWLDLLWQYEDLTPTTAHFPDIMKKAMLQNALNGIKTFKEVKNSEQLEVAKGRGGFAFQDYITLVQKVVANHDKDSITIMAKRNQPRIINQAEIEQDDWRYVDHYPNNDEDYNEGVNNFGLFSINKTKRCGFQRQCPALRKEVWQGLSKEDQLAWDQVSNQGKFVIMFAYKGVLDINVKQQANVTDSHGSEEDNLHKFQVVD